MNRRACWTALLEVFAGQVVYIYLALFLVGIYCHIMLNVPHTWYHIQIMYWASAIHKQYFAGLISITRTPFSRTRCAVR